MEWGDVPGVSRGLYSSSSSFSFTSWNIRDFLLAHEVEEIVCSLVIWSNPEGAQQKGSYQFNAQEQETELLLLYLLLINWFMRLLGGKQGICIEMLPLKYETVCVTVNNS